MPLKGSVPNNKGILGGKHISVSNDFVFDKAVPILSLLNPSDPSKLALEGSSWSHLVAYVRLVERMGGDFDICSDATREALTKVRFEAQRIGSPKQLRALLTQDPDLLAGKGPPATLYAAIAWLAERLHSGGSKAVSFLRDIAGKAEGMGSEEWKAALQELGRQAQSHRSGVGSITDALKTSMNGILSANRELSAAFKADAKLLQEEHETIGGLQAKVEGVRERLEQLGSWRFKSRKKLEEQVSALETELSDKSQEAEKLSTRVSQLERILREGNWLESAVDDLIAYVDKVGEVWTTFGSGVGQLAADASDTQLDDPAWMRKALGLDRAVMEWKRIDEAAKHFSVEALVDHEELDSSLPQPMSE